MELVKGDLIWHKRVSAEVPYYDLVKVGDIHTMVIGTYKVKDEEEGMGEDGNEGKKKIYTTWAEFVELDARYPSAFQVGEIHPIILYDHYWSREKPFEVKSTIKDRSVRETIINMTPPLFEMENQLHGEWYSGDEVGGYTFYRGDSIFYLSSEDKATSEGTIKVKLYPKDFPINEIVCGQGETVDVEHLSFYEGKSLYKGWVHQVG